MSMYATKDAMIEAMQAEIESLEAQLAEAQKVGCVLTYERLSNHSVCGNTVGADGSGNYAVVIFGNPIDAETRAYEIASALEHSSARVRNITLVSAQEGYFGSPIRTVSFNE